MRGQVAEDHVARLLAAERVAARVERLEHVAVADRGLDDLDAVRSAMPRRKPRLVITVTTTVSSAQRARARAGRWRRWR